MKPPWITLFLAPLLCLSVPSLNAELYRYNDGKGHTISSDRPIRGRSYRLVWGPGVGKTGLYKYIDSNGDTILTDRPMKNRKYLLVWRSSVGKIGIPKRSATKHSKKSLSWKSKNRKKHQWQLKSHYAPIIKNVAKKVKLNPELLHAVVQVESAYNTKAKSSAGAMGLMQLMPGTARRYGVSNVWDPLQNLEGGARYLRDLLDMFKNNLQLALAAYNAGEHAVKKYGNRIPPYPETQNYVRKVISFYLEERKQNKS